MLFFFLLCKALLDRWELALYKYCILLLLLYYIVFLCLLQLCAHRNSSKQYRWQIPVINHWPTNQNTPSPECRAFKSLYETSAVSLFARLLTPALLAARGFSTRCLYVSHAVTLIFRTNFQAKERLLAVYQPMKGREKMHRMINKYWQLQTI